MDLGEFFMRESYKRVSGLGDRLVKVKEVIDWRSFRHIVRNVYRDDASGGRPHTDEVLLVKCLLLQAWYGLSDPELEYQVSDRLSFRNFLDFPEGVPDFTTIWKARERLINAGADRKIWKELQRQLSDKGFSVKKGVIQDATFIESDQGKKRIQIEKKLAKESKKVEYSEKQLSHIDKDASYTIKNKQVHYGYKNHIKMDVKHQLIRDYEVTTASTHDSKINLVREEDLKVYRDKAYIGTELPLGIRDMTMKRAVRGHPLNTKQEKRNNRISKIRSRVERSFSVTKRTMHNNINRVTTLARVSIKELFKNIAYNAYQLVTLLA